MNHPLEQIYNTHHQQRRGNFFVIFGQERGSFLEKNIGKGKKVLDIGCRDGALTSYYCKGNDVLGIDIDGEALERAHEKLGIQIQKIDLNGDWGLPAESFDVVVAAEVLEHVYYPNIVLEKISKVLKPDGILIGSIPHAFSVQNRLRYLFGTKKGTPLQDPTHINHFWAYDFKKIVQEHFKDVVMQGIISWKFKLFSKILPFHFAHSLLFLAKKK